MRFYIADCAQDGGVSLFSLSESGIRQEQFVPLDRPMYLTLQDGFCHVVLRAPFADSGESGVVRLRVSEDGTLSEPGEVLSTRGAVGCHITAAGGGVFVANYQSGSVTKLPDKTVQHHGSGVHPVRQTSPHTHMTAPTPDGKALCVTDLGTDRIVLYDFDLNEHSQVRLPDGSGPRHLVFSRDGKQAYCACELSSEIAVFRYEKAALTYLSSVSTLPAGFTGTNAPAAIRLAEPYLYVSNRGHDSIAVFDLEAGGAPVIVPSGGNGPWDFDLRGDLLVCCNHKSGNVTFFKLNAGIPEQLPRELRLKAPICVAFAKEENA